MLGKLYNQELLLCNSTPLDNKEYTVTKTWYLKIIEQIKKINPYKNKWLTNVCKMKKEKA